VYKTKLTILHPADPVGPKIGGAESFLREFVRFAPENIDLTLIGVSCDRKERPVGKSVLLDIEGREFRFIPLLIEENEDRKRAVPLALRYTYRLFRSQWPAKSEVVLHNRIESLAAVSAGTNRNLVIIHNDIPQQIEGDSKEVLWSRMPNLYYRFESNALRKCDRIYSVSSSTLNDYRARYSGLADRFEFVSTCVDSQVFRPETSGRRAARLKCNLLPDIDIESPWILFVGRLQPQKAPDRLIETMQEVTRVLPSANLLVVGDGNLLEQTKTRASATGLEQNVSFLGARSRRDLIALYQAADVLLVTSDYEGMPMSVLESLASGTPVVSTPVGEVARVVKNGVSGEVIDLFSKELLAKAVLRVLGSNSQYSPSACRQAVNDFSPARVMEPIYQNVIQLAQCQKPVHRLSIGH